MVKAASVAKIGQSISVEALTVAPSAFLFVRDSKGYRSPGCWRLRTATKTLPLSLTMLTNSQPASPSSCTVVVNSMALSPCSNLYCQRVDGAGDSWFSSMRLIIAAAAGVLVFDHSERRLEEYHRGPTNEPGQCTNGGQRDRQLKNELVIESSGSRQRAAAVTQPRHARRS
jgi:hypothetical protein